MSIEKCFCQERLMYWGDEVLVGVTVESDKLMFKPLKEISLFPTMGLFLNDGFYEIKKRCFSRNANTLIANVATKL